MQPHKVQTQLCAVLLMNCQDPMKTSLTQLFPMSSSCVPHGPLSCQRGQTTTTLFCVDSYSPAVAGANQGPQMMGLGVTGRAGALGPDGAAGMGTPMMPDNGAMVMYPDKPHSGVFPLTYEFCPQ